MRIIDANQMSSITGGGFWDGFCAAADIAAICGVAIAWPVAAGCIIYNIYSWQG